MQRMGVAYSCVEPLAALFGVRATVPALRQHCTTAQAGQTVMPRKVETGQQLHKLEKVNNARDLAEACANIRPGLLFRSACPNAATAADIEILRDQLKIRQLVDLRSEVERREDHECLLLKDAEIINSVTAGHTTQRETFRHVHDSAADPRERADSSSNGSRGNGSSHTGNGAAPGVDDGADSLDEPSPPERPSLTVHHVALLEKNRYYRSLLTRIPRLTGASALFWSLINLDRAKSLVLKEVNAGGLPQLYEILLDSAMKEICQGLKIIRAAAERGESTLFFCKIGKDRTGLMAALVLAACGATNDEIISDYNRSDGAVGVQVALGGLEHDKALKDLDVAAFSRAPREAMARSLEYIDVAYGSTEHYLDIIGFNEDERDRLRAALSGSLSTPDVEPGHS
jgi:protein tyrosine/serine phosphatase